MGDLLILPQDAYAEQAVLGSVFIAPEKLVSVADYLQAEDFFQERHSLIYKAMQEVLAEGAGLDVVTLKDCLTRRGQLEVVGGLGYLAELVNAVPTSTHIEHYARIVVDKARLRQVIKQLSESVSTAYKGELSLEEIVAKAEQALGQVNQQVHRESFRSAHEVLSAHFERIEKRASQQSQVTGLATGFERFDQMTTGLHEDNLIILAARPAMGKTALALNIAQYVASQSSQAVAIFSLEMGADSLIERLLASEGTIMAHHIRTGQLSEDEWRRLIWAQGRLAESPIYIDDTAGLKIADIRSRSKKLAHELGGLGLIVIDYLQLITGRRSENRQQEVSEISRQLKVLAKELKVPIIALSQLSRGVEQRQDKRPLLSDLRESGSIEQDADMVLFLYREAYYQKQEEGQVHHAMTELILAKNRHGALGTVNLYFHQDYTKFTSVKEESA